jgi:hypothetical protein
VIKDFPQKVKATLLRHYESAEVLLKIYNLASIVCLVIDLLSALVFLVMAGKQENSLAYLSQLFIVTLYFYADVFLIFYMIKLFLELPKDY